MKTITIMLTLVLLAVAGCDESGGVVDLKVADDQATIVSGKKKADRVVIANRGSADISVLDARTGELVGTYDMPNEGQPMYAVHSPRARAVYVGDRANDQVVAFNDRTFEVIGTVPAGSGVFHMWASPNGRHLLVNNDLDFTTTVIDPTRMTVRGTLETPADLVALGGKPHDVFVDPNGRFGYVSVLGIEGENDFVVKYSLRTMEEVDRVAVGQDPHLFADNINGNLYVACQNTNELIVVKRRTMEIVESIPFDGAHGIFMPRNGRHIYVADIGGSRIGTFKTRTGKAIGPAIDAPFPTAHNLSVTDRGDKLFVTHSGPTADQVSIYDLGPEPTLVNTVTVGTNPFGLVSYSFRRGRKK